MIRTLFVRKRAARVTFATCAFLGHGVVWAERLNYLTCLDTNFWLRTPELLVIRLLRAVFVGTFAMACGDVFSCSCVQKRLNLATLVASFGMLAVSNGRLFDVVWHSLGSFAARLCNPTPRSRRELSFANSLRGWSTAPLRLRNVHPLGREDLRNSQNLWILQCLEHLRTIDVRVLHADDDDDVDRNNIRIAIARLSRSCLVYLGVLIHLAGIGRLGNFKKLRARRELNRLWFLQWPLENGMTLASKCSACAQHSRFNSKKTARVKRWRFGRPICAHVVTQIIQLPRSTSCVKVVESCARAPCDTQSVTQCAAQSVTQSVGDFRYRLDMIGSF